VIGLPFNDLRCLGSITEVLAELIEHRDDAIQEIAKRHPTTESLAEWIRGLPQRDDDGAEGDGPKIEACSPPQRLQIPSESPNCVERSALYLVAAEFIDPRPTRQLATLDTPIGLHTFPLENGVPVILDPRVPRNCLDCGVALVQRAPVVVEARDAIDWTTQLAESGAANVRNGPSRVRTARNAIMQLVDEGTPPATPEIVEAMGWMLALAEKVARRFGPRALAIVRTTAQAISDLADEAIARQHRNMPWLLAAAELIPAEYRSALIKTAGRVGLNVGASLLRSKLASYGIGEDMVGLVEEELNREGLTLGAVARPKKLPTLANFAVPRAA